MISIKDLAAELGMTTDELVRLKNDKSRKGLDYEGYGRNTRFTDEGAERLRLALESPLAVPSILRGLVLHEAKNPRWVFVKVDGRDGKVPVLISPRFRGKLLRKRIHIEAVTDTNGTTYRHFQKGRSNDRPDMA